MLFSINEVLLDIKPGETKQLKINTPGNEVNDEILTANLFLYNTSNFETDLVLKRKQLCQCKLVEVSQGISFRSNIYDCPHRYLFNLELADQHFYVTIACVRVRALSTRLYYFSPMQEIS